MKFITKNIYRGQHHDPSTRAEMPFLFQTSTFEHSSPENNWRLGTER